MAFEIDLLAARHDRTPFACGEASLDTYLKQQATQDMRRRLAFCYVLHEPGSARILGYYTLSSTAVRFADLPPDVTKRLARYPQIPAVLLGRLAVDQTVQGQGISELLLVDALARALNAEIAAHLMVVDALHERAAGFYEHFGFRRFADQPLRLYLPLAQARQLFPTP